MAEYTGVGGPGDSRSSQEECEKQETDENCWIVCSGKTADTAVNKKFPGSKPELLAAEGLRVDGKGCNCVPDQCGGREKCKACEDAANAIYKALTARTLGVFPRSPKSRYNAALKKLRCQPLALCLCA